MADQNDQTTEGTAAAGTESAGTTTEKTYTEADIKGLKDKNAELIRREKQARERAAVLGDRTPEDVQADLEFAAKAREEKARAEGNFEALKQQLIQQHTAEREKIAGRVSKVEGKLYDVLAKREAESAITAAGGNPKVLLPHILPFIKVTEQDDDFTAQVVDAKGNARIADGQATPMTIAQLVESFKADETFGVAFSAGNAAGSGARNESVARGQNGAVVISAADAKDVLKYRAARERAMKAGVPFMVAAA